MNELKVYHCNEWHNEYTEFYIKSEADKMIANLDESHKMEVGQLLIEIAELKKEKEYTVEQTTDVINGQELELRHQKYKRCLAMKKMCQQAQYRYSILSEFESSQIRPDPKSFKIYDSKFRFYLRWRKRWLAIAKKFKEAK